MSLSAEDSLRLNVLLVNSVAIRIDEGAMIVYGLLKNGDESKIQLNANCHDDRYIKTVRELLSSNVLGSPGGYPVFLKRWTRMGQKSDNRLEDLLLLGEPEAVVAVCGAKGITGEIARRAWWAMPNSDNARQMLKNPVIVKSEIGKVLADFLIEFLPFEQDPKAIIESVALTLQEDLITEKVKQEIWKRGQSKSVFRIGFLQTLPDRLPESAERRSESPNQTVIDRLKSNNRFAMLLDKVFSANGQSYLKTCEWILKKPANQDSVVAFLEALITYFDKARIFGESYRDINALMSDIDSLLQQPDDPKLEGVDQIKEILAECPAMQSELRSMLLLAHANSSLVSPIFAVTDAVGSVMRKKIKPVTEPLSDCIKVLQGS